MPTKKVSRTVNAEYDPHGHDASRVIVLNGARRAEYTVKFFRLACRQCTPDGHNPTHEKCIEVLERQRRVRARLAEIDAHPSRPKPVRKVKPREPNAADVARAEKAAAPFRQPDIVCTRPLLHDTIPCDCEAARAE